MKALKVLSYAVSLYCLTIPAAAHDKWANGVEVPSWVKRSCCGPEDVHRLTDEQVHTMPDGWHIDGYRYPIAYNRTLPSQDGFYWAFYREYDDGSQSAIICFFAPAQAF